MTDKEHWPRWLFASFTTHFYEKLKASVDPDVMIYIEGNWRDTSKAPKVIEIRMDGPYVTEISKDYYRLYTEISILVQATLDQNDAHILQKLLGKSFDAFTASIKIFKFGSGPEDDQSLLGCATLINDIDRRERVQVNNFGLIDKSVNIAQGTVEGHYELFLDTPTQ